MNNGTCVCAGYTSLTAAMSRYAGIPARNIVPQNIKEPELPLLIRDGNWF